MVNDSPVWESATMKNKKIELTNYELYKIQHADGWLKSLNILSWVLLTIIALLQDRPLADILILLVWFGLQLTFWTIYFVDKNQRKKKC